MSISPLRPRTAVEPAVAFVLASVWIAASFAGGRLAGMVAPAAMLEVGSMATTVALLFIGFAGIARLALPDLRLLSSLGFVRRPTAGKEFGEGVALGWAVSLAMLMPAVCTGNLALVFSTSPDAWQALAGGLLRLVLYAVLLQLLFAGLPARLLLKSAGPGWTVVSAVIVAALLTVHASQSGAFDALFVVLSVSLLVTAFLRTRAIWLSLGLQVGWTVTQQLLFGIPSSHTPQVRGPIQGTVAGPQWLTGGAFGPETAFAALLVLAAALLLLFRMTRTYAWHYTYEAPIAGGYAMEPPPAAAKQDAKPPVSAGASLIQIGGIAPAKPAPDGDLP